MSKRAFVTRRAFVASTFAAVTFTATRGMAQTPPAQTPESPLGPFYPVGYTGEDDSDLTLLKGRRTRAAGEVIEVSGRVLDRRGNPLNGASIEIWQANAFGRYAHENEVSTEPLDPNFQGVARLVTGSSGEWRITTIKPKFYDSPIGLRTPHIHFDVQGRTHRLAAQMYFPEEQEKNEADSLYRELGAGAPASVARLDAPARYRWDIVLMDAVS
jgi:protocatechuate 3,4-dioxygenase, beta subunit